MIKKLFKEVKKSFPELKIKMLPGRANSFMVSRPFGDKIYYNRRNLFNFLYILFFKKLYDFAQFLHINYLTFCPSKLKTRTRQTTSNITGRI